MNSTATEVFLTNNQQILIKKEPGGCTSIEARLSSSITNITMIFTTRERKI